MNSLWPTTQRNFRSLWLRETSSLGLKDSHVWHCVSWHATSLQSEHIPCVVRCTDISVASAETSLVQWTSLRRNPKRRLWYRRLESACTDGHCRWFVLKLHQCVQLALTFSMTTKPSTMPLQSCTCARGTMWNLAINHGCWNLLLQWVGSSYWCSARLDVSQVTSRAEYW